MARPFLMDATVPRPAPRIPIIPTPFTYEKPTPQVPDLSLIFDSSPSSHSNNNNQNSSSLLPPSSRDNSANRGVPYTSTTILSNKSNFIDSRASTTSPQNSQNMNKPMSFEVQVLYDIVKRQEDIIIRMDNQIKNLVESQDNNFKSLVEHHDTQFEIIQDTLLKVFEISQQQQHPKIKTTTTTVEKGIQTDAITTTTNTTTSKQIHKSTGSSDVNNATSTRKDSPITQNQQQKQNLVTTAINMNTPSKLPNIERSRSASGSSSSSSSSSSSGNSHKNNNNTRKDVLASSATTNNNNSSSPFNTTQSQGNNSNSNKNSDGSDQQQQQLQQYQYHQSRPVFGNSDFQCESNNNNRSQDFSGILRDIQLPTIRESSLFSEASIQPINLQDYNDSLNESDPGSPHIGPSVSAYGSSDDDDEEVVQPTPTFYQNILGNVNKMLENNRTEATLYGSTDTTVYGMSSNNLSFATKEYLQRYGLVKPKKPTATNNTNGKKQQQYGIPESNRIFSNEEVPVPNNNNNNRILDMTALRNQPKLL